MKHFGCSIYLPSIRLSSSVTIVMGLIMSLMLPVSAKVGTLSPGGNIKGSKSAAKAVVNKLVAEDFEGVRTDFNEQMKQGLSAEQMKTVWTGAIQHHGKYKSQSEAIQSQQEGYDVYTIRCEMMKSPMEVVVAYDQDGKIGGLWVRPAPAS